ncbi:hypothetical protein [Nonomuraea sediminis]|uniref:hypothetical protein n=1 Tax=Nonomuraea sediminis TaxID=2835864 RepID=UPI001BDBBCA4|nr:hypothetical protein [Nonomuraea sediminis]
MYEDRYPGQLALPLSFPNRRFRVWSYVPAHSELVLRTEYVPDAPHVELLFKPVEAISLPVRMEGLVVMADDQDDGVTFHVRSDGCSGYVVASYLFFRQEERSRYSPYSLFHGILSSDFTR